MRCVGQEGLDSPLHQETGDVVDAIEVVDPRKEEFIALLQALNAELVSTEEAKGRLKTLYPKWFESHDRQDNQ